MAACDVVWRVPPGNNGSYDFIVSGHPNIPTRRFEAKDLGMLVRVFSEVHSEWMGIGYSIRIPNKTMEALERRWAKSTSLVRGLMCVLDEWLRGNFEVAEDENLFPCWRSVVYVISYDLGGKDARAASTIAEKWQEYESNPFFGTKVADQHVDDTVSLSKGYDRKLEELFIKYLKDINFKWFEVGVILGVPVNILIEEVENISESQRRIIEAIKRWLKLYMSGGIKYFPLPTMRALLVAVEDPMGGANQKLAKDIAADPFVMSLGQSKVVASQPPPTSSIPATSKHDTSGDFSDEMNPDELHGYLCANMVPESDCQRIRELKIGGATFMHFDEEFWKKNQISEVGQFYIGHTKEKIKKSVRIQHSTSTASTMAVEYVKNNRNEFEKALGIDMVWLATEMSRPDVGMMTEEECKEIKTPRLLTEAQKRGAIVNALVRTLELDIDGQNLALFLQILEKKPQQYKKAITMLKGGMGEPHNAATHSVTSFEPKTAQTDTSDAVVLMKGFDLSDADWNQKVSDIHVIEISGSLCKKWRKLYPFLGLKEIVAYDADRNNFDETEKKMAFFNEWKQQKAYEATYKNLVHALLRVGARDDAISVCEMLAQSLGKKSPKLQSTTASTAPPATIPPAGVKKTVKFSKDLVSDQLYEYLTTNGMPKTDAQKIKDLNIGGTAFLHLGEDFWKENGITSVGLLFISHIKKKIPDVPASTQISNKPSSPPPFDIQSASGYSDFEVLAKEKGEICFSRNDFVLTISENTFEQDVKLRVRKVFAMPFKLPTGYCPASYVYEVVLTNDNVFFQKKVAIQIRHCATLRGQKDCSNLMLMRASSAKSDDGVYTFSPISGGKFTSDYGEIVVDHLSHYMVAAIQTAILGGLIIGTAVVLYNRLESIASIETGF